MKWLQRGYCLRNRLHGPWSHLLLLNRRPNKICHLLSRERECWAGPALLIRPIGRSGNDLVLESCDCGCAGSLCSQGHASFPTLHGAGFNEATIRVCRLIYFRLPIPTQSGAMGTRVTREAAIVALEAILLKFRWHFLLIIRVSAIGDWGKPRDALALAPIRGRCCLSSSPLGLALATPRDW